MDFAFSCLLGSQMVVGCSLSSSVLSVLELRALFAREGRVRAMVDSRDEATMLLGGGKKTCQSNRESDL